MNFKSVGLYEKYAARLPDSWDCKKNMVMTRKQEWLYCRGLAAIYQTRGARNSTWILGTLSAFASRQKGRPRNPVGGPLGCITNFQSAAPWFWFGLVIWCCSSPTQPFLVSGPVGNHDLICVRSMTVYVFINWVYLFDERNRRHCRTMNRYECAHTHTVLRKGHLYSVDTIHALLFYYSE
jgi:hypothetical protein